MQKLVLLLILVGSASADAVYYPLPAGHRESFMANAGSAMKSSPGNPLYNAAGLGFRDTDKMSLSVSGTALGNQTFSGSQFDTEPEEMTIRPLMAAGIYPTRFGTAALFVANPINVSLIGGTASTSAGVDITTLLQSKSEVIKIGAGFGAPLGERWAWGLSGGLILDSTQHHSYSKWTQGGAFAATTFIEGSTKQRVVFLAPALMGQVTDHWTVALSMQALPLSLESTGREFVSTQRSDAPTTITQDSRRYDPHVEEPMTFNLGQSFALIGGNMFYLDVAYLTESKSRDSDGTIEDYDSYWSAAVGWRNTSMDSFEPLMGYARTELASGVNHLVSGGILLTRGRSELILGAYYMKNEPKDETNGMKFTTYGVMFSSNVAY